MVAGKGFVSSWFRRDDIDNLRYRCVEVVSTGIKNSILSFRWVSGSMLKMGLDSTQKRVPGTKKGPAGCSRGRYIFSLSFKVVVG